MLDYIIENFRRDSKFINDFESLNNYLKELNISLEDKNIILREVFEYNNKMHSIICEDNKKLEKIVRTGQELKIKEIPTEVNEIKKTITKPIIPLNIDINFYIQRVRNCDNLSSLEGLLPDKKDEDYYEIVYALIIKLYEEVYEIKKSLHKERHSIDVETSQYFKGEIDKSLIRIEYIKQLMKTENKQVITEKHDNNLIFLKTNYGNVCVFNDLKDIPAEYYEQFYELLESICNGTFKNFKTFTSNGQLKGMSEVKGDGTRVIFDRISNNTYVIIYMFMKRTDKNASYHASLQNRNDLYKQNYNEMRELLENNSGFLEENRNIKEKLYNILTKPNKVKKLGDING